MLAENNNENGGGMAIVYKLCWLFRYDAKLTLFWGAAISWEKEFGQITTSNLFDLFTHSDFFKYAPAVRNKPLEKIIKSLGRFH